MPRHRQVWPTAAVASAPTPLPFWVRSNGRAQNRRSCKMLILASPALSKARSQHGCDWRLSRAEDTKHPSSAACPSPSPSALRRQQAQSCQAASFQVSLCPSSRPEKPQVQQIYQREAFSVPASSSARVDFFPSVSRDSRSPPVFCCPRPNDSHSKMTGSLF